MSTSSGSRPRTIRAIPTVHGPAIAPISLTPSVRQLGFWSAVAMATTYVVFFLSSSFAFGVFLRVPWDQIIPIGASLLIAPSFVMLMVSLHYAAPEAKRIWSHAAIAFAILYAAFVSMVYVTLLFVVEPHVIHHTESDVGAFLFGHGTFVQMLDGLGYTYMSLAVCLTAPLFAGGRLNGWIRGIAIASGPAALGVLVSYVVYTGPLTLLGVGALLVPVYGVFLAIYFHRAALREGGQVMGAGEDHHNDLPFGRASLITRPPTGPGPQVERPIEEVFDFLADERNEPKYNAQMTRADKVTPGPIGVGTKFHPVITGVGGAAEMTIEFTEFDRPRRIVETTHLSNMDINGALLFEPAPEGTRMTWIWDLYPRGFFKFLGPLVGWMGDRQERTIWSGLKRLLESRPEGLRQPQAN